MQMLKETEFKYTLPWLMIVALVFIIYSNTFHSPWILDDFHNIVDNPKIQINSLSIKNIKGSFYSSLSKPEKLYRPLSCFSFAMNALVGGKDVIGYHFVNISLHAATSLMLMWLLILVFRTPALEKIPDREKHFIVLLSTVLWAVNPIQIQSVTYIVQRMASLCAFFSLMSLGFFIEARLAKFTKQKIIYYICCTVGIACSFFSKENGIITIPLILVLEYFLFGKADYQILTRKEFIAGFLIFIVLALCFLFYTVSLPKLQALYEKRPFTLYERLLTQPKILLYYLSLIFYPLPQRFSLEHEILISSGIFSPPQTFLYIALMVSFFTACVVSPKIPLLIRFGAVFYFVAHSIESSILPLEMVFEHRNYLPSVFLFPPVAVALYHVSDHLKSRQPIGMMIRFFIIAIIFLTSIATYTRNFDWGSGEKIWFDAMNKAPGHARPKQSMGFVIGMKNPEMALRYYSKALTGYMHDAKEEKASTLANMGLIFFHQHNYESARHFFQLALETDENYMVAFDFLIQTYMKEAAWDKAIQMIDKNPNTSALESLKAACLLHIGDYNQALDLFREIYRENSENQKGLLNIAEALSMAGYQKRATFFYGIYLSKHPEEPIVYLRMSKNYYLSGDTEKASELLSIFFKLTGAEKAGNDLQKFSSDILFPIIGIEKMEPFIESEFEIYKQSLRLLPTPSA
ncbi:MAG: hypothetical protein COX19_04795 [Desulfobacterales bacterium CG23_combo_of_CG06-09_8_20_14_all_51_8]|nr:MAG: hypothetical protein COX19_04795 [Desulfobacterales bacterium CG23_combo_of_CG06-09_8_20_14_all_51_8]